MASGEIGSASAGSVHAPATTTATEGSGAGVKAVETNGQAEREAEAEEGGEDTTGGTEEFSAYPSDLEAGTDTSDVSCHVLLVRIGLMKM